MIGGSFVRALSDSFTELLYGDFILNLNKKACKAVALYPRHTIFPNVVMMTIMKLKLYCRHPIWNILVKYCVNFFSNISWKYFISCWRTLWCWSIVKGVTPCINYEHVVCKLNVLMNPEHWWPQEGKLYEINTWQIVHVCFFKILQYRY